MKKKLLLTISMICVACLSACGKENKKDEAFAPKYDTEKEINLTVIGSYNNFEALETEFDYFNDYYPNVHLSYQMLDSYANNLESNLRSEEPADIFFSYDWYETKERYQPILNDLCEDLSNESLGINYQAVDSGLISKHNGEIKVLPIFATTHGMLVNEKIFKDNNLKVPTTSTELQEVSVKLKELGYQSPMMTYINDNNPVNISYPLALGYYTNSLKGKSEDVKKLNTLDASAGELMRDTLTKVKEFMNLGAINVDYCKQEITSNSTDTVLLRFMKGDVPMLLTQCDNVSSSKKRESKSEEYQANPFEYNFHMVPFTEQGSYFFKLQSVCFSLNKRSLNKEYAAEFLRFLYSKQELKNIAENKGMLPVYENTNYSNKYTPINNVKKDNMAYASEVGLTDEALNQLKKMGYLAAFSDSLDEVIATYGTW